MLDFPVFPGHWTLNCWRLSALLKGTLMVALHAGWTIHHLLSQPFFLQTTPNFALNWQTSSSRVAPATLVVWWTTLSLSQRRVWACSPRQVIKNYIAGNTFNSIYVWAERKISSRENSKIIHKHPVCSIWPFLIFFSFLHICKKNKRHISE